MKTLKPLSSSIKAPSDFELLEKIAERNEAAFTTLLQRHLENTRGLVWRILASHSDVDDIAQEVFLKLWRNPTSFNPGKAKFSTWLYRVTLNACIDRKRQAKNIQTEIIVDTMPDKGPTPESAAIAKNRANRVQAAIAQLPDRQRHAIALSHFQGVTNIEAAEILDTSVEAIESLLGRARRALKKYLENDINELLEGAESDQSSQ